MNSVYYNDFFHLKLGPPFYNILSDSLLEWFVRPHEQLLKHETILYGRRTQY